MSTSNFFTLAKALALTTSLLPSILAAETGSNQVAITTGSRTFTAFASFGDVVLEDASSTATINPGQHTEFDGISVSAIPERSAIVVEGSATYGLGHALPSLGETIPNSPNSPSALPGDVLPIAIITNSGGASITVSPVPSSFVLEVSTATATIGAGDDITFAGLRLSALSNNLGVSANHFTFTLNTPVSSSSRASSNSSSGSGSSSSAAMPTRSSVATTLIAGTNSPTSTPSSRQPGSSSTVALTTLAPSTSGSGGSQSGSSQSSNTGTTSTGNAAAATFTSGDLSIVGWLASSIGMLMFAFGL